MVFLETPIYPILSQLLFTRHSRDELNGGGPPGIYEKRLIGDEWGLLGLHVVNRAQFRGLFTGY